MTMDEVLEQHAEWVRSVLVRTARVERCTELEAERDAALAATAEWRKRMVEAEVRAETQALEARVRELEDRIERARRCCNCPALDGAGEDDNG